ncbi:MAG: glycosyltransferase family 4 protein [Vicinamibacterales bacterium]
MKIVLASPHFPPRFIGGVETFVKRLADGFLRLGDQPTVIAVEAIDGPSGAPRIDVDSALGYPVYRVSLDLTKSGRPLAFHYGAPQVDQAIGEIISAISPDIVHLHSGYLLGVGWLARARAGGATTLLSLHDYWVLCPRMTLTHPDGRICSGPESAAKCAWCLATERRRYRVLDTWTGGAVGRTVARLGAAPGVSRMMGPTSSVAAVLERQRAQLTHVSQIDAMVSPSRFMRDQAVAAGFPGERIHVIRSGVVSNISRRPVQSVGPIRRFGFLGQVAPHKGVHVLIDAVRRLEGAPLTLTIHGDLTRSTDYVADLRARAAGDERITFAGAYTTDDLDAVFAGLDVVVVPSTWYENAPFVILEAQRAGLPLVASRLGGMQELISDERDGLLATAGDGADLARQLARLLDSALVCKLAAAAPAVRTFEEELHGLREWYAAMRAPIDVSGGSEREEHGRCRR